METKSLFKNTYKCLLLTFSTIFLLSCGGYQSVYNDGIYGETPERKVIVADQEQFRDYEENYFTKELERLNDEQGTDIFTDIENYRSLNEFSDENLNEDEEFYEENSPWGYDDGNNDVVININTAPNVLWNDFGWNNFGWRPLPWNNARWGAFGWNHVTWSGFGWNRWNRWNRWNNFGWGFNRGFVNPYWNLHTNPNWAYYNGFNRNGFRQFTSISNRYGKRNSFTTSRRNSYSRRSTAYSNTNRARTSSRNNSTSKRRSATARNSENSNNSRTNRSSSRRRSSSVGTSNSNLRRSSSNTRRNSSSTRSSNRSSSSSRSSSSRSSSRSSSSKRSGGSRRGN